MAFGASQIGALLRPGLIKAFADIDWGIAPPLFPEGWRDSYNIALRQARALRAWDRWLLKHKPSVRERLAELNPNGCPEGCIPRGWNRKFRRSDIWVSDLVSESAYMKKWRHSPTKIAKRNGRHKFVTRLDYQCGTAHYGSCAPP